MSVEWPLGYKPPEVAGEETRNLGIAALQLLRKVLETLAERKAAGNKETGLLYMMLLQGGLFLETADLAIEGHARGHNRAAFGLQSSLFEYLMRAIAYRRGIVDAEEAWHLGMAHRIAAEKCRDTGAYERWKAENPISAAAEKSFEQILGELFENGDGEWKSWIYQRYRRPRLFARGTLGAVDDVFDMQGGVVRFSETARTIDPDAQVVAIACLACDFVSEFNDHYALGFDGRLEEFQAKISGTAVERGSYQEEALL
jgi:hypothetical protein